MVFLKTLALLIFKLCPLMPIFLSHFLWGMVSGFSDMNLSENISSAQCRASCLRMFTATSTVRDESCHKNTDCYICWNSCRLFQGNSPARSTLCNDRTACFPGCQTVCKFYDASSPKNLTPPLLDPETPLPASMGPPRLTNDGKLVWEPPLWPKGAQSPSPNEVIMYIVMVNRGQRWEQHIQTSSPRAIIPDAIKDAKIRVLAVTSSGLAAFADRRRHGNGTDATDVTEQTTERLLVVETTTLSIKKLMDDDGKVLGALNDAYLDSFNEKKLSYDYDPHEGGSDDPALQPPSVTIDHSWVVSLDLLSLDLLASVRVRWEVRGSGRVDYMVTWTESAGGISGHLVTKQDRAEISVWSGQQYSVQVELLDQHGNSVLRSVPKTISFGVEASSAPSPTAPLRHDTRRRITSDVPSKRTPTTPSSVKASTKIVDFISSEETDPVRWKEYPSLWNGVQIERSPPGGVEPPSHPSSSQRQTPSPLPLPTHNFSFPFWRKEDPYSHDTFANSHKVGGLDEKQGDSREDGASPLMAWAACLGVGAVVIVVLIAWAVRTLRKSAVKRQEMRRQEEFLSETTTSSSVNSSSMTTCSQPSIGSHSRGVGGSGEPPWAYETFYGVATNSQQQPPQNRIVGIHRPPPPPLHAPPSPPMFPDRLTGLPLSHTHNHGGAIAPSATPLPSVRVDNASFIENYILALDPSPMERFTHHHH